MEIFNKKENPEIIAKHILNEYDPEKYGNLVRKDKPDLQSTTPSVGVEVTIVEFDDIIKSNIVKGKTLYEYTKVANIPFTKKIEFEGLQKLALEFKYTNQEYLLDDFIDELCYLKEEKLYRINNIEEFIALKPSTKLFNLYHFKNIVFDKETQIILQPLPSAVWTGNIINKLIESLRSKNSKFIEYKNFSYNELFIFNFSAEQEEYHEFESILCNKKDEIYYDKIIICNYLFDKDFIV